MSRSIRLLPSFLTVGSWTLLSRIFGFLRDIAIAATLGSGPVAEAFLVAFSLPNMFRRFFAEGAFNMAFVPMFSKKVEDPEVAREFGADALSGLAGILIVFTLVAQLFMPWLVLAMASGFRGDARFDLAVEFGRIAFPYILFISIAALLSGVLNALGRFAAAAAAPVLLNVIFLFAIMLALMAGWDIGHTLVWSVPIAGLAQLFLVWVAANRAGMRLLPRMPKITPELKRLAVIAAPAALAGGVVQINLLVGRQVASFYDGAIAWLNYADRLYQLPLGLVGVAIGVVLLPDLSRRLQAGDGPGGQNAFNRANEFSMALTLPAAVALIVIPLPLVSVLFERGAFMASDSAATAKAVAIYGAGLPAFVLLKTVTPLYFAREDTRTPFRFALVSMVVNIVLAVGLMSFFGYLAAAIGTTVAAWANLWLLWRGARNMGEAAHLDDRLRWAFPRILGASLIMGAALLGLSALLENTLTAGIGPYLKLGLLIALGGGIYILSVVALGAVRREDLRQALRKSG